MSGMRLRKYGVQTTIDFEVFEIDGVDLRVDWTPAQVDCEIMKDGGASTLCDNTATDEGSTYSIVLTATEMEAARLVLKVVDAATKVFLDTVIHIETYGNASAQHAFDLDTASVAQGADNNTILSSLTIANGAVDSKITYIMDTILTETAGGRLAAAFIKLLDVVTPVLVASDVMVGTDGANTTTPDEAGVVATFIGANGANLTDLLTATGFGTADPGDAMNLAADAIKAVSYDELTAFPLVDADAGVTQVARVGADGDTLETLSDQIDSTSTHDAAAVKTAMEADNGDLDALMKGLINKRIWKEEDPDGGDLEMHNDAGGSIGTVEVQVDTDGSFTTAKRAFQAV